MRTTRYLGEKPGVGLVERSESIESANGKVKMCLQCYVVAGKAGTIWECLPKSQKRAVTVPLGNQLHHKYPTSWEFWGTDTDPDWQCGNDQS